MGQQSGKPMQPPPPQGQTALATPQQQTTPAPTSAYAPSQLQQVQPQTQGLPEVASTAAAATPTNPNPSALAPQGANVQGDVWAPGTGPSGGYNGYGGGKPGGKGGMPPSAGGGANGQPGNGQQAGGTSGGNLVGGGWQPGTGGVQAPTTENFGQMQNAVRQRYGDKAAESYATDNWQRGGQAYAKQKFGDDTEGYNNWINQHSPGASGGDYISLHAAMRNVGQGGRGKKAQGGA